ncbi:hypothetical protein P8452_18483 [Trifolium repens]|nr:hypothetical protein P8452_18483 [Trifolium repens]
MEEFLWLVSTYPLFPSIVSAASTEQTSKSSLFHSSRKFLSLLRNFLSLELCLDVSLKQATPASTSEETNPRLCFLYFGYASTLPLLDLHTLKLKLWSCLAVIE